MASSIRSRPARAFSLTLHEPATELAGVVDRHWVVRWDLLGREPYVQDVLPHPCVNLAFEPERSGVFGIPTRRFRRELAGAGAALARACAPGRCRLCRISRPGGGVVLAPPASTARAGARLVQELAARHGVVPHTLQRLFRRYVGVGPKWVLQRYRMHEAAERMLIDPDVDLARLALELGYADQAHFGNDFHARTGRTPAAYLAACAAA